MSRMQHTDVDDSRSALDLYHPAVPLVYFSIVIVLSMAAFQPVFCVLSLVGALIYGCYLRGWRSVLQSLSWSLPLVLIVALLNPFFSAFGSTRLFVLLGRTIYFESLAYGFCMGLMLTAMMQWFLNAAVVLTFEKVMAISGNVLPTVGLMLSMIMRLVPMLAHRGREVEAVQQACTAIAPRSVRESTSLRIRETSVLMGWSLEGSLQTADAMRARGWAGAHIRSVYQRYRFGNADLALVVSFTLLGLVCAFLAWVACTQYTFYPTMTPLVVWWGYLPYALLLLAPLLVELKEVLRWMR
jgi:energy-coupling factor transport system permease protein